MKKVLSFHTYIKFTADGSSLVPKEDGVRERRKNAEIGPISKVDNWPLMYPQFELWQYKS